MTLFSTVLGILVISILVTIPASLLIVLLAFYDPQQGLTLPSIFRAYTDRVKEYTLTLIPIIGGVSIATLSLLCFVPGVRSWLFSIGSAIIAFLKPGLVTAWPHILWTGLGMLTALFLGNLPFLIGRLPSGYVYFDGKSVPLWVVWEGIYQDRYTKVRSVSKSVAHRNIRIVSFTILLLVLIFLFLSNIALLQKMEFCLGLILIGLIMFLLARA